MKYLVLSKFRLTDQGIYLDTNTVFEPDSLYERTSRSFFAAKRAGWLKQLTDKEVAELDEKNIVQQVPPVQAPVESKVQSIVKAPVGIGKELRAEDIADEVVGGNIIDARDRRRQQVSENVAQAKKAVSEVRNASEEVSTAATKRPIDQPGGEKVKINKTKAQGPNVVREAPVKTDTVVDPTVDVAADIKSKMDQKIRRKKMGKIRFEKV